MFGHQLRLGRLQRAVTPPSLLLDFLSGAPLPPLTVSRPTGGGRIDPAGQYELVAANQPRIDYDPVTLACRGLLVEEQRTNLLINSQCSGAAAGSPGSLPTGWSIEQLTPGLSWSVVSAGLSLGVGYVDIRIQGVISTVMSTLINMGGVSVSAGSYTLSAGLKIIAGSLPASVGFSGGGSLGSSLVVAVPAGELVRRSASWALTTGTLRPWVQILMPPGGSGAAVDVTLRIAAPQLEEGIFGTSYIPTSGAQATRAADSITCAVGAWYSAAAGSLLAEWLPTQYSTIPAPAVFTIAAGGNNGLSANGSARWWNGASSLATANSSPIGTIRRDAASWSASSHSVCLLGGTVASDGAAGINGTPTALRIGSASASSQYVNGHLRRVVFWPQQIDIQRATA
jgi:hypothetical protein